MNKKNKDFTIIVLGQIISLFGSAIQRFALSLYLLDLTGSASIFASILAISVIPVIILSPFAGVIADRFHKRNIMVILDFISGAVIAAYAVILFSGRDHYLIVATVMLLLSGISTLYQPSVTASIPLVVKGDGLMKANGIVQQVSSMANFLGPMIAGVLYGFLGIKGIIVINGISFFVSAVMELFLEIPFVKVPKNGSTLKAFMVDIKDGLGYLKNENVILLRMVCTSGLYNLFLASVFGVGTPYVIKVLLGMDASAYGVAEAFIAFGMIAGSFVISHKPNLSSIQTVYKVLYPSGFAMMLMGFSLFLPINTTAGRILCYLIYAFFGMTIMFTIGIANVLSATYTQQVTPNEFLGKTSAFTMLFATISIPLGQTIFGWLLDLFPAHISIVIAVCGLCTFLVTLLVRWNVRQIK
ncbi:major facilitator superfamily MFS_1 [Lachnospiraceae bacterium KM106-2]|nr:major facilitator superfamily MFS_1 [Lachnospiraceae bacterium KM106-2]